MEELIIALAVLAVYFLPSWTAASRHVPNAGSIVIVNLFLGWTFVGWVVALAMAYRDPKPQLSQPALPVLSPPRDRAASKDWWKR